MGIDRGFRLRESTRLLVVGGSYVDWIDVAIVVAVHLAVWKKSIREEGQQDEFGECKQFIAGERESSASDNLR